MSFPRFIISGLAGGTGKTFVSLGAIRAFANRGLAVRAFKKGPDYIDTAWLARAARNPASNLDPFMLPPEGLLTLFSKGPKNADLSVIEGNRGFFDGRDLQGSCSTAELAKTLDAPVVLVVDCTKVTRTVAALVSGCRHFPEGERIAGVILNRAARSRHGSLARRAVEELAGLPVFGVLPRLPAAPIFERREGLVTVQEHRDAEAALDTLAGMLEENADLNTLLDLGMNASPLPEFRQASLFPEDVIQGKPRIGVVRDAALWQYYDENLEALRRAGAEIIPLSLLRRTPSGTPCATPCPWPELDGLYLGGGDLSPCAETLAADHERRAEVAALIDAGLPVYAEQAGLFYLLESYRAGDRVFPMAGLFPFYARREKTPQGLGYVEADASSSCPYFFGQTQIRGHEFRFETLNGVAEKGLFTRNPMVGLAPTEDGFLHKQCFGSLMQIFAPAVPGWAERFVRAAAENAR